MVVNLTWKVRERPLDGCYPLTGLIDSKSSSLLSFWFEEKSEEQISVVQSNEKVDV